MLAVSKVRFKHKWEHYNQHNNINTINDKNKGRIIVQKSAPPFTRALAALRLVHFSDKTVKV